ncbi:MAG: aminodeoxychorismate/anthranilate synthase component II [Pirellulaceae bacterium]|nr:aminodeoxychorismate/anthranilate synthase component II [Pirellulaceae bacterium]
MLLLIDNYDSFVHNLARYFERLGVQTLVVRNDAVDVPAVERLDPAAIVVSPGPCTPSEAGASLDIVRHFADRKPILGICLGHQTIGAALGANVVRGREPVHGRASQITHGAKGIFAGLPSPLTVGRYHSLVVEEASLPPELVVSARTADGTIMALAHRERPVVGLQFHPESILTDRGYDLLAGFLRIAGLPTSLHVPTMESERPSPPTLRPLPSRPVTF